MSYRRQPCPSLSYLVFKFAAPVRSSRHVSITCTTNIQSNEKLTTDDHNTDCHYHHHHSITPSPSPLTRPFATTNKKDRIQRSNPSGFVPRVTLFRYTFFLDTP